MLPQLLSTSFRDCDHGLSSFSSSVRSVVRSSSDSFASGTSSITIGPMRHSHSNRGRGGMSPARAIVRDTRASNGSGRTVELKD